MQSKNPQPQSYFSIKKSWERRFEIRNFKSLKSVSMCLSYLVENFFLVIWRRRIFFVFEIFFIKKNDFKIKFTGLTLASCKSCKSGASALFLYNLEKKLIQFQNFRFRAQWPPGQPQWPVKFQGQSQDLKEPS
jgi:hypothetical protein